MRNWILFAALAGCAERLAPDLPLSTNNTDPAADWARLLDRAATPEGTNYDLIEQKRDVLDRYVAWMGNHGPEEDRMGYSDEHKKIAFMANAYNAAVVYAVLERRPIESVQDVQVGIYRYPNAGFFLGQQFRIDGEWISLYYLEHQYLLAMYEEPGIHMMLNCASVGCPPLRFWGEEDLQTQMDAALTDYLNSPKGMQKDEQGWAITELFEWYEDQFVDWSAAENLCAYLAGAVSGERQAWLEAQIDDCTPRTFPYDWALNGITNN